MRKTTPEILHILSPYCEILTLEHIQEMALPPSPELEQLLKEEIFALDDGLTWHLIPPVMKLFLESFQQPNTLNKVITAFAQKANCSEEAITSTMQDFFKNMVKKKILQTVDESKNTISNQEVIFQNNEIVSDYRIISNLFVNKKIEIYQAEQVFTLEKVAIKVLKLSPNWSEKQRKTKVKAFIQEFELLKEIGNHQHICQLIEVVQNKEHYLGVLELVEGKSLRHFIKTQQPLLSQRLHLMQQLLSAMAHLHQKGIVHGDIHISNILLHQNHTIKLIDFNLGNRLEPKQEEFIHYGGVYQYIAPEKVDSRGFRIVNSPANPRSEVYQLGVVLYYLLYEKMPFEAFSWKSLALQIQQNQPDISTLSVSSEFIPFEWLDMLKKALHKNPEKRFASAVEWYEVVLNKEAVLA